MRYEWVLPRWPDVELVAYADANGMPWGVGFDEEWDDDLDLELIQSWQLA